MRKIIVKENCIKEVNVYIDEVLRLLIEEKYEDLNNEESLKLFAQSALTFFENPNYIESGLENLKKYIFKLSYIVDEMLSALSEKKKAISQFKENMYQNFLELTIETFVNAKESGEILEFPYIENKSTYLCKYNAESDSYERLKLNSSVFKEKI